MKTSSARLLVVCMTAVLATALGAEASAKHVLRLGFNQGILTAGDKSTDDPETSGSSHGGQGAQLQYLYYGRWSFIGLRNTREIHAGWVLDTSHVFDEGGDFLDQAGIFWELAASGPLLQLGPGVAYRHHGKGGARDVSGAFSLCLGYELLWGDIGLLLLGKGDLFAPARIPVRIGGYSAISYTF